MLFIRPFPYGSMNVSKYNKKESTDAPDSDLILPFSHNIECRLLCWERASTTTPSLPLYPEPSFYAIELMYETYSARKLHIHVLIL